jgi:hypothetical protein
MAEKPKTKEEFIKFLDREIKNNEKEIMETLEEISALSNREILVAYRLKGEYIDKKAKEMGIPEEWLKDPDFYEKFKKYLIYEAISEAYLPVIKDNALRLVFDLYRSVERSKEKLEELI